MLERAARRAVALPKIPEHIPEIPVEARRKPFRRIHRKGFLSRRSRNRHRTSARRSLKTTGASEHRVQQAINVQKADPELLKQVARGEKKLAVAAKEAKSKPAANAHASPMPGHVDDGLSGDVLDAERDRTVSGRGQQESRAGADVSGQMQQIHFKDEETGVMLVAQARPDFEDDQLRVRDLDLAVALEYQVPRDIRKLTRSNLTEIEALGICATVALIREGAGRPGTEYWFTEEQAIAVCQLSQTPRAAQVRIMLRV